MTMVMLHLRVDLLESFMIRIYNELLWKEIMAPIVQSLNHNIEFFVIDRIFLLCFIQFFIEKCNGMSFLIEHASNSHIRCITSYFKYF